MAYQKEKTLENAIPLIKKLTEGVGANMLAFYTNHEGNPNISVKEKSYALSKFGEVAVNAYNARATYKTNTLRKAPKIIDVPKIALNFR